MFHFIPDLSSAAIINHSRCLSRYWLPSIACYKLRCTNVRTTRFGFGQTTDKALISSRVRSWTNPLQRYVWPDGAEFPWVYGHGNLESLVRLAMLYRQRRCLLAILNAATSNKIDQSKSFSVLSVPRRFGGGFLFCSVSGDIEQRTSPLTVTFREEMTVETYQGGLPRVIDDYRIDVDPSLSQRVKDVP